MKAAILKLIAATKNSLEHTQDRCPPVDGVKELVLDSIREPQSSVHK